MSCHPRRYLFVGVNYIHEKTLALAVEGGGSCRSARTGGTNSCLCSRWLSTLSSSCSYIPPAYCTSVVSAHPNLMPMLVGHNRPHPLAALAALAALRCLRQPGAWEVKGATLGRPTFRRVTARQVRSVRGLAHAHEPARAGPKPTHGPVSSAALSEVPAGRRLAMNHHAGSKDPQVPVLNGFGITVNPDAHGAQCCSPAESWVTVQDREAGGRNTLWCLSVNAYSTVCNCRRATAPALLRDQCPASVLLHNPSLTCVVAHVMGPYDETSPQRSS